MRSICYTSDVQVLLKILVKQTLEWWMLSTPWGLNQMATTLCIHQIAISHVLLKWVFEYPLSLKCVLDGPTHKSALVEVIMAWCHLNGVVRPQWFKWSVYFCVDCILVVACIRLLLSVLIHWGRDKMPDISQTLSNAFSWMKIYEFRLVFHWSLFLRVQSTTSQHWFR